MPEPKEDILKRKKTPTFISHTRNPPENGNGGNDPTVRFHGNDGGDGTCVGELVLPKSVSPLQFAQDGSPYLRSFFSYQSCSEGRSSGGTIWACLCEIPPYSD